MDMLSGISAANVAGELVHFRFGGAVTGFHFRSVDLEVERPQEVLGAEWRNRVEAFQAEVALAETR
jgi:hypothetical protein